MSTPKGYNKLWANCKWTNADEKLAFFNHYYKNSPLVTDRIDSEVKRFKDDLLEFIKEGKIKEGNNTRSVMIKDIVNRIQNR